MSLSTGQILKNRYRIDTLMGQGGMGAVYRAYDTTLNITVAIKENLDTSPQAQKQFEREAHMLAGLFHPNLPRVTDYFFVPGQGEYLVMDFVEGEDLQAMLNRLNVLPETQVLTWIGQVCDALTYLHRKSPPIIHRDIKPANIKIRADGQAMLVDFGIAKIYDQKLATTMGAKAVTPGYSPPEQYGGNTTDARADIYALGATLYTMLTGQIMPESVQRMVGQAVVSPPRKLNQKISPGVEQAILKATDVSTDRRFQSVDELRTALVSTQRGKVSSPWSQLVLILGVGFTAMLLLVGIVIAANFIGASLPDSPEISPATAVPSPTPTRTPQPTVALPQPRGSTTPTPTNTRVINITPTLPRLTPTSTPLPLPISTQLPIVINLWVDQETLLAGECTYLYWSVRNVSVIYMNDDIVSETGTNKICPNKTTIYNLFAVGPDGSSIQRAMTVKVVTPTPVRATYYTIQIANHYSVNITLWVDDTPITVEAGQTRFWEITAGSHTIHFCSEDVSPSSGLCTDPTTKFVDGNQIWNIGS